MANSIKAAAIFPHIPKPANEHSTARSQRKGSISRIQDLAGVSPKLAHFNRRIETMSTIEPQLNADELTQEMLAKMEEHGITRFPVYYFRFGQYTYSSLSYAIAQAERERSGG